MNKRELVARAAQILSDGQWHDLELVVREMSKLVPPGQAVRELERSRRNSVLRKTGQDSGRATALPSERQVASGKRLIVMSIFQARHNKPYFEVHPPASGGRRRVLDRKVRMIQRPKFLTEEEA